MMSKHASALSLALAVGLACASFSASAGIKCWTNKDGVRECGNTVPPEYAQQGHRELNKRGLVVNEESRAKTREELAEEARIAKLAEEAELRKLEQEELAKLRAAKDRVLLDTFTTEADLVRSRDDKLAAIESQIQHTRNVVKKLEETLARMQTAAANRERSGKAITEEQRQNIAKVHRQITDNLGFIEQRYKEKGELSAMYDADLARFRELVQRKRSS